MIKKLGWINGRWGNTNELQIPINDRGLSFGDGIFETILIQNNKPKLLMAHLNRWQKSAKKLGMSSPPSQQILEELISEVIRKSLLEDGTGSLRINWSRGSNSNRGINLNNEHKSNKYRFWVELTSLQPCFKTVTAMISSEEKRNAHSLISQCKTFNYLQSIHAKQVALNAGFDDALLLSTSGEMCCGTTANIIVKRNGTLLTPRLASGCLPGIMREQGLKTGIIHETNLSPMPNLGDEWLLINSLGCHPIAKIGNKSLDIFGSAESLWKTLLIE